MTSWGGTTSRARLDPSSVSNVLKCLSANTDCHRAIINYITSPETNKDDDCRKRSDFGELCDAFLPSAADSLFQGEGNLLVLADLRIAGSHVLCVDFGYLACDLESRVVVGEMWDANDFG